MTTDMEVWVCASGASSCFCNDLTPALSIVHRAPCRLIADNAGIEGEVIVQALKGTSFQTGYNAMDDRIENLIEAGVIDPAKVRVCCLLVVNVLTSQPPHKCAA